MLGTSAPKKKKKRAKRDSGSTSSAGGRRVRACADKACTGTVVERHARTGKTFFSCDKWTREGGCQVKYIKLDREPVICKLCLSTAVNHPIFGHEKGQDPNDSDSDRDINGELSCGLFSHILYSSLLHCPSACDTRHLFHVLLSNPVDLCMDDQYMDIHSIFYVCCRSSYGSSNTRKKCLQQTRCCDRVILFVVNIICSPLFFK